MNRENYISHSGDDFIMKGQHLRSQIIKSKKVPMRKKMKGSEIAKNESELLEKKEDDGIINEKDVMYVKL